MSILTVPIEVTLPLAECVRAWLNDNDPDGDDPEFAADRAALDAYYRWHAAAKQIALPLESAP